MSATTEPAASGKARGGSIARGRGRGAPFVRALWRSGFVLIFGAALVFLCQSFGATKKCSLRLIRETPCAEKLFVSSTGKGMSFESSGKSRSVQFRTSVAESLRRFKDSDGSDGDVDLRGRGTAGEERVSGGGEGRSGLDTVSGLGDVSRLEDLGGLTNMGGDENASGKENVSREANVNGTDAVSKEGIEMRPGNGTRERVRLTGSVNGTQSEQNGTMKSLTDGTSEANAAEAGAVSGAVMQTQGGSVATLEGESGDPNAKQRLGRFAKRLGRLRNDTSLGLGVSQSELMSEAKLSRREITTSVVNQTARLAANGEPLRGRGSVEDGGSLKQSATSSQSTHRGGGKRGSASDFESLSSSSVNQSSPVFNPRETLTNVFSNRSTNCESCKDSVLGSRPRVLELTRDRRLNRSESGDPTALVTSSEERIRDVPRKVFGRRSKQGVNGATGRSAGSGRRKRSLGKPSQAPASRGENALPSRLLEDDTLGLFLNSPLGAGENGLSRTRLVGGVNGLLPGGVSSPSVLRPGKVAFLFLANGSIHTDRIWNRFFAGAPSEDHYSVYIHSNLGPGFEYNNMTTNTSYFYGRTLPESAKSRRFHISLVDAHRKLLRSALQDTANQWFVLLSDSCVPLHDFAFTYRYLFAGTKSFIDSRYFPPNLDRHMPRWTDLLLPEVSRADFRKGSQWVALTRKHASMVAYDEHFYSAFARRPWNCQDEHYISTMLPLLDLHGIEERTLTYVNWRSDGCPENCGSPRPFTANTTSRALLQNITRTSSSPRPMHFFWKKPEPCFVSGRRAPCYLFARKFAKDSIDKLLEYLPYGEGAVGGSLDGGEKRRSELGQG